MFQHARSRNAVRREKRWSSGALDDPGQPPGERFEPRQLADGFEVTVLEEAVVEAQSTEVCLFHERVEAEVAKRAVDREARQPLHTADELEEVTRSVGSLTIQVRLERGVQEEGRPRRDR